MGSWPPADFTKQSLPPVGGNVKPAGGDNINRQQTECPGLSHLPWRPLPRHCQTAIPLGSMPEDRNWRTVSEQPVFLLSHP